MAVNIKCENDDAANRVRRVLTRAGLALRRDYTDTRPYLGDKSIRLRLSEMPEQHVMNELNLIGGVTVRL